MSAASSAGARELSDADVDVLDYALNLEAVVPGAGALLSGAY
jgi:hypothetical protein